VSVHIFNLLTAAVRMSPDRSRLLVDADAFPTDRYLAASVGRLANVAVCEVPMAGMHHELKARGGNVAAVLASAVDYRSGELWDVAELTAGCHAQGAVAVWDLCHAVGAIALELDRAEVDLAVGCTYKYLSGGPGSPAFAYVAQRHQRSLDLPLTGWHGHARPLEFEPRYAPAEGIARARIGTPQLLSLLALEEAVGVFADAPIAAVRRKSLALGELFLACVEGLPASLEVGCITPRDGSRRGSHVALTHPRGREIVERLADNGLICDFRPPDTLRFGFNALYVSFEDVFDAVHTLADTISDIA
jgi:kynureninase